MLVSLNEIMKIAEEKNIAIGAFNITSLESIQAVIAAAQELNIPVILQYAEIHSDLISIDIIGPIAVSEAKKAAVPVCVHLDHGCSFEVIQRALELGFTGVMYDGSTLPYEENVRNTKKAVEMAKKYSVPVEGEIGSMGLRENSSGNSGAGIGDDTKIYTDPKQAKQFVDETGIDLLACSFGTTHGLYITEPKLDFDVVKNVRGITGNIPVVMHGGSGVSESDYYKAIDAGVRKINYFTYMDKAGGAALKEYINSIPESNFSFFSTAIYKALDAMKENVKTAMRIFSKTN